MSSNVLGKLRRLRHESLEDRRCLSAESVGWDGPGLGGATLSYHLVNVPGYLDEATVDQALNTAMSAWSDVIDVNFVKTDRAGQANSIDVSFAPIDGSGGTLAQAYLPDDVNPARIAGDIQFDSSERWEIGNAQGSRAFDLVMVAVHELGHALGLDHSHASSSVMAASVSAVAAFSRLATDDIDAALSIYAPATASTSTATPTATLDTPLTTALAGGRRATPTSTLGGGSTRIDQDPTTTTSNTIPQTPTKFTPTTPTSRWSDNWHVTIWSSNRWGRWLGSDWSFFNGSTPTNSSTWLTNLTTRFHTSLRSWWV